MPNISKFDWSDGGKQQDKTSGKPYNIRSWYHPRVTGTVGFLALGVSEVKYCKQRKRFFIPFSKEKHPIHESGANRKIDKMEC
jgi:hypothetical protein